MTRIASTLLVLFALCRMAAAQPAHVVPIPPYSPSDVELDDGRFGWEFDREGNPSRLSYDWDEDGRVDQSWRFSRSGILLSYTDNEYSCVATGSCRAPFEGCFWVCHGGPIAAPFEPALEGGQCQRDDNDGCWSLQVGADLGLRERLDPGVSLVEVNDPNGLIAEEWGGAIGDPERPIELTPDFLYGMTIAMLAAEGEIPERFHFLQWMDRDGLSARLVLELYRGDRAEVERILSTMPVPENTGAGFCPEDEADDPLLPVWVASTDLDRDGVDELIATYANGTRAVGACNTTVVRRNDATFSQIGTLPPVAVHRLRGPRGEVPALVEFWEGGDLDQAFGVWTLRHGTLTCVFSNFDAREGARDEAFGTWHTTESGLTVIAVAHDQGTYSYGFAPSFEGFELLLFDGEAFTEVPESALAESAPLVEADGGLTVLQSAAQAAGRPLERIHPPSPRGVSHFPGLRAWNAYGAGDEVRVYLMSFDDEAAAQRAEFLIGRRGSPGWVSRHFARRGRHLLYIEGAEDDLAAQLVAGFGG